ncbi:MAG: hypothetical protein OXI75_10465 [Rhodospirillales bacterium]|nr:hypothetical protein [Rhodospirillales bacterium]
MAPEERRSGLESGKGDFDGRDLLVGRPEGAEGRSAAGTSGTPQATPSPQPCARDDVIQEILETVRTTAARIDALQEAPGPEHETAEALAREMAALTQAVDDARGTLAETAELAAQQDGQATAGARSLAEGAAALKVQGAALDKRLRATGKQAEAAAEGMEEMKQTAMALDSRLRTHAEEVLCAARRQRWRPWLTGLAIGAASFVFFVLGAVLQRETNVVSFGDPRHQWNDYVVEHYAPLLGICASKARLEDRLIGCRLEIEPSLDVTVPFYPGGTVRADPSEGEFDPTVDQ